MSNLLVSLKNNIRESFLYYYLQLFKHKLLRHDCTFYATWWGHWRARYAAKKDSRGTLQDNEIVVSSPSREFLRKKWTVSINVVSQRHSVTGMPFHHETSSSLLCTSSFPVVFLGVSSGNVQSISMMNARQRLLPFRCRLPNKFSLRNWRECYVRRRCNEFPRASIFRAYEIQSSFFKTG